MYKIELDHDKLHDVLEDLYLDWVNNFITLKTFANHYGLTEEDASVLIKIGRNGSIWE